MIVAKVTRVRPAKGKVLSVGEGRYLADGTLIAPAVKPGDFVVYNPHMVGYELEQDGEVTIVISTNAIYGRYQ